MVHMLHRMYINQTLQVRFNQSCSDSSQVSNGVKQGGVLSTTLFCIYVCLLTKLQEPGVGGAVGDKYVCGVSYADDLCLLAPTQITLKKMIIIGESMPHSIILSSMGIKVNLWCLVKLCSVSPS